VSTTKNRPNALQNGHDMTHDKTSQNTMQITMEEHDGA